MSESWNTPRTVDGLTAFQAVFKDVGLDVFWELPAEQPPGGEEYMAIVTTAARVAVPTIEVIWVPDPTHGRSTTMSTGNAWGTQDFSDWISTIESEAATNNVLGLVGWGSLGVFHEQPDSGYRSDGVAHLTSEGNRIHMDTIFLSAAEAALPAEEGRPAYRASAPVSFQIRKEAARRANRR
jgi:hypothetical protein